MSLINEALKKAQRARLESPAAGAESAAGSGPIVKRAQPKSARTMLLLGAGAVVLVVGSMVGTALWVTRPVTPATAPKPPPAAVAATNESELPAITPLVSLPSPAATPPPASSVPPKPTPTAAPTLPAATPVPASTGTTPPVAATPTASSGEPVSETKAEPLAATPPSPAVPVETPPPPPPKPDERIQQLVDSFRVMGIRSSGNESKVLMNDRVYRVNDVVDRTLGVKLIKVAPDSLTFSDPNGATYVKYF